MRLHNDAFRIIKKTEIAHSYEIVHPTFKLDSYFETL